MENYELGESGPEILESKKYTLLLDSEKNILKNISISLYSDDCIEFVINIIKPIQSKYYKDKFTFSDFQKYENNIFVDIKTIFDYFCELIKNNIDSINFYETEKKLILKESNKEYTLELKEEKRISEYDIVKLLFKEINNKKLIDNIPNFSFKQIDKNINQIRKSICCIIKNNGNNNNSNIAGNGFFILVVYQNKFIPLLITSNIIISENDFNNGINLKLILYNNNKENIIKLRNNMNHYINDEYGISIIELKENIVNIQYLELDESIIQNNDEILNNKYNNESIYTIQYKKEKDDIELFYGKIESIKENDNIIHKCFSNDISLGSPILLSKNNKVIGIHTNNKEDIGNLLLYSISQFLNSLKKENINSIKENLINEIKIENSASNEESNNIHIKNNNQMIIEYFNSDKEDSSKTIFSKTFVNNNKTKCVLKYENKIFNLNEEIDIYSSNETFKIILEEKENETVTDMSYMFNQIFYLKSMDITNWNTEKVNNMSCMFSQCKQLEKLIGINNMITDNVISMSGMFYESFLINQKNFPDISSWNMKNVKDISKMFMGMKWESVPNLSKWELNSVENMSGLFSKNTRITDISSISKWKNITKIIDISNLFSECTKLLSIPDLSNWNLSNVKNISYLFNECTNLINISCIEKWEMSNLTKINNLFSNCENLQSIPNISKWDISSVDDMSYLFHNCKSLKSLPDISNWNTSNVENMNSVFCDCTKLESFPDISSWKTNKVKDMSNLFKNCKCKSLKSLPDISNWETSNVENISGIFYGCSSIQNLPDISKWKTANITDMSKAFSGCKNLLTFPDISTWDFSKVTKMGEFCYNCKKVKTLPEGIYKIKLKNKISCERAFYGCKFKIPKNFEKSGGCVIY